LNHLRKQDSELKDVIFLRVCLEWLRFVKTGREVYPVKIYSGHYLIILYYGQHCVMSFCLLCLNIQFV